VFVGCVSLISQTIIAGFGSDAPYYLPVWAGRVYEFVGCEVEIFGEPALQDFGLYINTLGLAKYVIASVLAKQSQRL